MIRSVLLLLLALRLTAQTLEPGQFLVATKKITEPGFARSVILIIHVDGESVVGLMLNRPLDEPVSSILPDAKSGASPAWAGGPVPTSLYGLAKTPGDAQQARKILPDVYLLMDKDEILQRPPDSKFRVYAGYCGWGPGQLQGEMQRGNWRVRDGEYQFVFDKRPASLWDRLMGEDSRIASAPARVRHFFGESEWSNSMTTPRSLPESK